VQVAKKRQTLPKSSASRRPGGCENCCASIRLRFDAHWEIYQASTGLLQNCDGLHNSEPPHQRCLGDEHYHSITPGRRKAARRSICPEGQARTGCDKKSNENR
jgi:hypothetical protein